MPVSALLIRQGFAKCRDSSRCARSRLQHPARRSALPEAAGPSQI